VVTTRKEQTHPTGQTYTFARHETFHVRDGWLFKGLEAVQADACALYARDAHHGLGIGLNMLKSLCYWLQATNLVQAVPAKGISRPPLRPTRLATLVYAHDPYLEDLGTLWLLHLELAANRSMATFWYWAFNECTQRECTEEQLVRGVQHFLEAHEAPGVAVSSLHKDARCFLRTYVPWDSQGHPNAPTDTLDSPFIWLGLLRESAASGHYAFQVGPHRNLPAWLFAYTLYRFKEQTKPAEVVFSLEDVRWAPLSPGRLLCLDTRAILMYLEELEQQTSYAHVLQTAGLNLVTLDESIKAFDILTAYYTGRREEYA
jgi:hypothetical protein